MIAAFIALILILAWSPWITKSYSEKKVLDEFSKKNYGIMDGCGSWSQETGRAEPGHITSKRTIFGYIVYIEYYCGFVTPNTKPTMENIFVSFLGI